MIALLSIAAIVFTAYGIIKGFKPQIVLLSAGYFLMLAAIIMDPAFSFVQSGYLSDTFATGSELLNIFALTGEVFTLRTADFGINVMAIAGFSKYMDEIGASRKLVSIMVKPMSRFHSPYVIMSLSYVLGQMLAMVIPSASGLGMLLMVILYPVLINMGVSKLSATAIIGSTSAISMGPGSSYSLIAAKNANVNVVEYFVNHQLPVGISIIIVAAVAHYFVQKYFDKKELQPVILSIPDTNEAEKPLIYAFIPFLPICLLLFFSKANTSLVQINLITSVIISIFVGLLVETIMHKSPKKASNGLQIFFDGMGVQFAKVQTLIVSGEIFADGLKIIGFVDFIVNLGGNLNVTPSVFVAALALITSGFAVVMGSGHAPFIAFSGIVPDIADNIGVEAVDMILPMQYSASIMRCVSPISGVIVAVSGISGLSTISVVKRTAIPMLAALAVNILFALF